MKMERDFMGLAVKQETPDDVIDAVPLRSSAMQWPFSNKSSALPQLLSFQGSEEEKPKTGFDSLAPTGLVTITTTEAVDSDIHKSYSAMMPKNVVPEKQGGVRYAVTTYPTRQLETHAIHHAVSSQTNPKVLPGMGAAAVHHSFVAAAASGQNLIGSISPQFSGVPMANPVAAMPSTSPVVGTTDLRNSPKISRALAQLTIFYNGSVCVYDNVSHEKAQAIMLLAGNGPPTTSSTAVPSGPVQASITTPTVLAAPVQASMTMPTVLAAPVQVSKSMPTVLAPPVQPSMPMPTVLESFVVNQPYSTTTRLSSPAVINPISVSQSAGRPSIINDMNASKQGGGVVSSNKVEPMKVVNSLGSSATLPPSDNVPQFRRKSLARFLEKRKERVINASPYANEQSQDCSTPGASSTSLSVNSSGSCPVPPIN